MCPPSKQTVIQQEKKNDAALGIKENVGKRQLKPYEMELTPKQILLTAVPAFIAFALGVLTRVHYLENPVTAVRSTPTVITEIDDIVKYRERDDMPKPVLPSWKAVPDTIYTFREFETDNEHIPAYGYLDIPKESSNDNIEEQYTCSANESERRSKEECNAIGDNSDEDEHLPAGQHLLVDIKNIDADFLNSDIRLAEAMIEVVNESKLTLLSYHCHSLLPMGVSCVGVLLESHISFHTWPTEGVITLDLFTCGSGKLMPVLPILERLFGVPRTPKDGESFVAPISRWVHKLRGFRPQEALDYLSKDIGAEIMGKQKSKFDWKKEIAEAETKFQRIDIYDLMISKKLSDEDILYEKMHPKLFEPDRIVYLDGVTQSSKNGLEPYHEALVQPAMFAHPNPKKVGIIGGGECATLREALKHKTVEEVKMMEIDEEMVQVSREHLPSWSDCSDLEGSADWCGNDERAEIYYGDALAWFNHRFSDTERIDSPEFKEEPFDVLIMDALDPQDDVPFAEVLYTNDAYLKSLYNALSDDGVIVLQLGISPKSNDPAESMALSRRRAYLMSSMERVGFESLHVYDEIYCDFDDPWSFLIAMKGERNRSLWYQGMAELDIAIHERVKRTHSGTPALKYFDAPTMRGYQVPHKGFESVFCKSSDGVDACKSMNSVQGESVPSSNFEMRMSGVGEGSGRGVFTKTDIKKGTFIAPEASQKILHFPPAATASIYKLSGSEMKPNEIVDVWKYMDGYGWDIMTSGAEEYFVDSGIMTFVNHGCNGTFNIDGEESDGMTEQNFDTFPSIEPEEKLYNPFADRRRRSAETSYDFALRDIRAGEEIFCNYLFFNDNPIDSFEDGMTLRRMCNGEEVGDITKFEEENRSI